ncbi:hypothetical protein [Hymenobacter yonginensis]|uniref:Uncharacterized protein n=1 Tax=Hymenobacter yonginensis TaxID=748197 RepID=A0ABY7PVM2_9BACT|nr:hypothetical protein [Hymenobacter yonginensis]WBO86707.1 hypothetical protein O9Z63_20720 [Hymenobacter yonginensis]
MLAIQRFEESFATFIEVGYGNVFVNNKWKYDYAQYRASNHAVWNALLELLTATGVNYDDFIEQELLAWSTPASTGNPLALPFTDAFLPLYANERHKYTFLINCLQIQEPEKDISAALIQACYFVMGNSPEEDMGLNNLLEFLGNYPNPAAVSLIAFLVPFITTEWYVQTRDFSFSLHHVLAANPGPEATHLEHQLALLQQATDKEFNVR